MKSFNIILLITAYMLLQVTADDQAITFKGYSFDTPDLYISYEKSNLKAYKSTKNDKILNESSTVHYNQLRWISITSKI